MLQCTGSMQPTFTCGDNVYGYYPPPPPLAKGTIVVYDGNVCPELGERASRERASWQPESDGIIHRISAVRELDGEVAYRTKGDANIKDDGCWVPHSAVDYVAVKR